MRYLLDTNICIYAIKARPPEVIERLRRVKTSELCISAVSAYELWSGVHKSQHVRKNSTALSAFLAPLQQLAFDADDAVECGKLRAQLESRGTPIGPYDLQIAAQARRRGLILVTNDVAEFRRVQGLKHENWATA